MTQRTPKPFGFWTATSLVIGNMIGVGIYTLPALLASYGPISLVGYMVAAAGALCLAAVYSQLTLAHPLSGGPYVHGELIFGKLPGFLVAWGYWIMNWTGSAATTVGVVGYISTFIPEIHHNRMLSCEIALAIIWFFTFINCLGLKIGGIVQVILTFLKLIPLIFFPLLAFKAIHMENFHLQELSLDFSAINATALLAMWSFIGLETATVPTENVANAGKTVSRATLFGTALTALLYLVTLITLYGLMPIHQLAQSSAPYADAAHHVFGRDVAPWLALCVIISGMGGLNGWILIHGQVPKSMAKDRIFPSFFAKSKKDGTPIAGLLVGSVLMSLVMLGNYQETLLNQYLLIISVGGAMTLFAYLISSLAAFKLLKHKKNLSKGFWLTCCLAALYSFWAIWGGGLKILGYCAIAYVLGIPVYLWVRFKLQNPHATVNHTVS